MAVAELFVGPAEALPSEEEALDAYSATVSRVAEKLLPVVASLRVGRAGASRPQGTGSAVSLSRDGLLVTSAHVVEATARGVAAFTDGDSDNLMAGRNGIFYDRKARDWDATITKIVDNPISIRQAFWAPYKKAARLIQEQIAKRASAADAADVTKLTQAVAKMQQAAATGQVDA